MRRRLALAAGAAALAGAWCLGLPGLARELFVAHMAMHLLVVAVAAPLLAAAMGSAAERVIAGAPALFSPLVASAIELAVVWVWHAPAAHAAARAATGWLALEQAGFLGAGLLVWLAALAPGRAGAGVLALLATSVHMTLLGALIALAPRPLYRTHGIGPAELALGLDPLSDQQLGGALMLLVGGAAYLIGGLALIARLLAPQPASAGPA